MHHKQCRHHCCALAWFCSARTPVSLAEITALTLSLSPSCVAWEGQVQQHLSAVPENFPLPRQHRKTTVVENWQQHHNHQARVSKHERQANERVPKVCFTQVAMQPTMPKHGAQKPSRSRFSSDLDAGLDCTPSGSRRRSSMPATQQRKA